MRVRDEVKRGAEYLDVVNPGWWSRINIYDLDMSDCTECILGQVYGQYAYGLGIAGIRTFDALQYGFEIPLKKSGIFGHLRLDENGYRHLTQEWLYEIGRRRMENGFTSPPDPESEDAQAKAAVAV